VNRAEGFADGSDHFFLVDAAVGYRLPRRFGMVSLSVTNIFDKGFKYMDDGFREFQTQPVIGPYIPERQFLGQLTLNW
jgi:TonB dependent receptor